MIAIHGLKKSYGHDVLFSDLNLQMVAGERLGLYGRNGHGKSTLFKLILAEEDADEGEIVIPKRYTIGHLAQHLIFSETNILAEACLGLPDADSDLTYKAEAMLFGLGFSKDDLEKSPNKFSGGYQIRLNLAKLLLSEPNLLLLDEPTNYLDIVSVRWLQKVLNQWPAELMVISHDRDFMDSITTHSAIIHRGQLKKIKGPRAVLQQQILTDEETYEKTRQNEDKKRKDMEVFISRFKANASKASMVQSRVKLMEKMPELEKLNTIEALDFEFRSFTTHAKVLVEALNLTFAYPQGESLFKDLTFTIKNNSRLGVIGKNGKGKSTLLSLLAGEHQPLTGQIKSHPSAKIGYFGQTNISRLNLGWTIEEEISFANPKLSRTEVRGICGTMMFSQDKAEKKVSVLSGGERSRVLIGKLLACPSNLLLLDEPTNHLDVESIDAMLASLKHFEGAVVIVTHSEAILKDLATELLVFQNNGVEYFNGGYQDFLERVGWRDEDETNAPSKRATSYAVKKEQEKLKRKLEHEILRLETSITNLEAKQTALDIELANSTTKNEVPQIKEWTQTRNKVHKQIEAEIELLTQKYMKKSEIE